MAIVIVKLLDKYNAEIQCVRSRADRPDEALDKAIRWVAARVWDTQDYASDYDEAVKQLPEIRNLMDRHQFAHQYEWLLARLRQAVAVPTVRVDKNGAEAHVSRVALCYAYHGYSAIELTIEN